MCATCARGAGYIEGPAVGLRQPDAVVGIVIELDYAVVDSCRSLHKLEAIGRYVRRECDLHVGEGLALLHGQVVDVLDDGKADLRVAVGALELARLHSRRVSDCSVQAMPWSMETLVPVQSLS